ncbi:MAG: ferredoxin family protein [Chloroflexi bacterium]|nr:ferredoxin family protein [Chloroflexota bacterium]
MISAYATNTLQYNPELCINCEMCIDVCPHGVFAPGDRAVRLVRSEACMECGACQLNCPVEAITVESGVGCATLMIRAALTGKKDLTCGGTSASSSCCGER